MAMTKAKEATHPAIIAQCTGSINLFRSRLDDGKGYKPGLGSYVLYGVNNLRGLCEVIATEATASDFSQHTTKRSLNHHVETYDHVISYRDTGTGGRPNVQIRVWFKDYI